MRRKIFKKMLAALLAGTMLMSVAGCGSDTSNDENTVKESEESQGVSTETVQDEESYFNAEGYPICDEPITITVSGQNVSTDGWNNTDMVAEIEKQFGIIMDCSEFESEAWSTQFTLMVSSDELPDLILSSGQDKSVIDEYGQEGYFLALNEYLDYMPNFKAFLEEHPDYEAYLTSSDGNIYGLTQYNENEITKLQRTFINGEWLENVNMEVPTNVDELYDVLKAFKEQDANGNGDPDDEIPLSGGLIYLTPFLHAFGIFSNDMTYSPYVDEDGNVILGQATDNYKAMLQYLHKLYEEGLYDVDALVQSNDEFNTKGAEERLGMYTTGSAPYVVAGRDDTYDAIWEYLGGLTSDYNDVRAAVYNSGVGTSVKIAVSADTEYPEAVCRLIDYFYSDEGSIVASKGFIGVSCEMIPSAVDESQNVVNALNLDEANYSSAEEYRYKKGIINEGFNVRRLYYGSIYQIMADMTDEQVNEALSEGVVYDWGAKMEAGRRELTAVDVFPTLVYTADESNRLNTLKTDITMYVEQACGQFITGELDIEENWDTYISTLESIGLDEIVAIEQAAYDRAYN